MSGKSRYTYTLYDVFHRFVMTGTRKEIKDFLGITETNFNAIVHTTLHNPEMKKKYYIVKE